MEMWILIDWSIESHRYHILSLRNAAQMKTSRGLILKNPSSVRQVHASAKSSSKSPMSHQSFWLIWLVFRSRFGNRMMMWLTYFYATSNNKNKYHRVQSEYRFLIERKCLPTQGKVGVRRETLFSFPHKLTEYNFIHRERFIADEFTWY